MSRSATGRQAALIELSTTPEIWVDAEATMPEAVSALVAGGRETIWMTPGELVAASDWLDKRGLNPERRSVDHLLRADWRFPDSPLVQLSLDGAPAASVDYLPASASAHWSLSWGSPPPGVPEFAEIAIGTLSTKVPDEVDADPTLQGAILDTALSAMAAELCGRAVDLDAHDI